MIDRFRQYCEEYLQNSNEQLVGLAISGGRDSVACAYMLNELNIPFVMVHCNFNLRGKESNDDQIFVENLGLKLSACKEVYTQSFDTIAYQDEHQLSVQEAARDLRYQYFDELYQSGKFSHLITAHHQDDSIETFFINLIRVSGISGLKGIPDKRDFVLRPMLNIRSAEIQEYVNSKEISYREDSSNSSNKYLRNIIRNKVLPSVKNELPEFEESVSKSMEILKEQDDLYNYLIQKELELIVDFQRDTSEYLIDTERLLSFPQPAAILYRFLDSFGFNHAQSKQAIAVTKGQPGKIFHSKTHKLLIQAKHMLLRENIAPPTDSLTIQQEGSYTLADKTFNIKNVSKRQKKDSSLKEFLSLTEQDFPLTLRYWEEGDFIYPLGMKGRKLVSDYFIDNKINRFDRHHTPLLTKGQEVIWIVGHRISEKYKVIPNSMVFEVSIEQ